MKLEVFASAWTFGSLEDCRAEVAAGHFDGIEGPPPASPDACKAWRRELSVEGVPFVAEVCTGGDYAPPSSVAFDRHLEDLRAGCVLALDAGARFVTCLGGSDA